MISLFAYDDVTGWMLGAYFYLVIVGPFILAITIPIVLIYIVILRVLKKKINLRKILIMVAGTAAFLILLSIPVIMANNAKEAALNSSEYLAKSIVDTERWLKSSPLKSVEIKAACKNTENRTEQSTFHLGWYALSQAVEGDVYPIFLADNVGGTFILCPGASVKKKGQNLDFSEINVGTKIKIKYHSNTYGSGDYYVTAIVAY